MKNTSDQPAFPCAGNIGVNPEAIGLSVREYFAAKALQGLIAGVHATVEGTKQMAAFATSEGDEGMSQTMAELAVDYADALIEQLAKE